MRTQSTLHMFEIPNNGDQNFRSKISPLCFSLAPFFARGFDVPCDADSTRVRLVGLLNRTRLNRCALFHLRRIEW